MSTAGVDRFFEVSGPSPHPAATRRLLARHPEIRSLIGRNPWSAAAIATLVLLQTTIAVVLARTHAPVWEVVLLAYTVGAMTDHALWALIHEATHRLIFPRGWANAVMGLLANLPLLVPGFGHFRQYHLRHHAYLGVYEHDPGLPCEREARLVGHSALRKVLWLACFPVVHALRVLHLQPRNLLGRTVVINAACQLAYTGAMFRGAGPIAVLYLAMSFWSAIGLHPLGARWIQEHMTLRPGQETYSYYGAGNLVSFNVGFHNEHHDFPSVPWNRLPRVRAIAREHYDAQESHRSWSRLFVRFVTDSRYSLWSMARRVPVDVAERSA